MSDQPEQTETHNEERKNNALIPLAIITLGLTGAFATIGYMSLDTPPSQESVSTNPASEATNTLPQAEAKSTAAPRIQAAYDAIVKAFLSDVKNSANHYKKQRKTFTQMTLPSAIYGATNIQSEVITIQKHVQAMRGLIGTILDRFDTANDEVTSLLTDETTSPDQRQNLSKKWQAIHGAQKTTYEGFFEIEQQIIIAQLNLLDLYQRNFDELSIDPVKRSFIFQNKTDQNHYNELINIIKDLNKEHKK